MEVEIVPTNFVYAWNIIGSKISLNTSSSIQWSYLHGPKLAILLSYTNSLPKYIGLWCTFCTYWKYYYIWAPPNLCEGFISLCVSVSGKTGQIYPCQPNYIIVWPTEIITWWCNKSYPYPILNLGLFYGAIATLFGVPLQNRHIPFLDTSMVFPNLCTYSSHSSSLGFNDSWFYFYEFWYVPMYKLISINWTTRP